MSLEYTKHMSEKDLYWNLPSARDIRAVLLLHCSLVTPNQQLKPSFQTFAAPPADETTDIRKQLYRMDCQTAQIVQECLRENCSNPSFYQP